MTAYKVRCAAGTLAGLPCRNEGGVDGFCFSHSPRTAGRRQQMAAKSRRLKAPREISDLEGEIKAAIRYLLAGDLDKADAVIAMRAYDALVRLIEVERRVRKSRDNLSHHATG